VKLLARLYMGSGQLLRAQPAAAETVTSRHSARDGDWSERCDAAAGFPANVRDGASPKPPARSARPLFLLLFPSLLGHRQSSKETERLEDTSSDLSTQLPPAPCSLASIVAEPAPFHGAEWSSLCVS
jgi:hypothetical protein